MKGVNWFVQEMAQSFLIIVDPNQVGYETIELYQEEIDDLLIPPDKTSILPNPMLIEIVNYTDADNNDWIGGIVIDQETRKWLRLVIAKNGKAVFQHEIKRQGEM